MMSYLDTVGRWTKMLDANNLIDNVLNKKDESKYNASPLRNC